MAVRARLSRPNPEQRQWPWHQVDSGSVPVGVLMRGDRRMEAENYLGSGYGTRLTIEGRPAGWSRVAAVATTAMPGRLKGVLVSPEVGTPYLAATQVFDARPAPRRWLAAERMHDPGTFAVGPGEILMTRSGNVGRSTLASAVHQDVIISDDLLRINARGADWQGWIYAYLRSPTVRQMLKASQYGHIIKHLETTHLDAMPILLLRRDLRVDFTGMTATVIEKRNEAFLLEVRAEDRYLESLGTPEAAPSLAFTRQSTNLWGRNRRLEAGRYNPLAAAAEARITSRSAHPVRLGDLMESIFVPGRFKHVYGPEGVAYLDSAQLLEVAPDIDKWILSLKEERQSGYTVSAGTLLMPCSGQLHGNIGHVVIADAWHEGKILNNHVMRMIPRTGNGVRIGYLRTVLAHPKLGRPRVLKYAFGSSVPELLPLDIAEILVPRLTGDAETSIADDAEQAAVLRSEADQLEDQIQELAEDYVRLFLRGHTDHLDK